MNQEDTDIKSAILLSARLKFSPSATMRVKTINRIVEQCLCASPNKCLTLDDLVKKGNLSAGTKILRRDDLRASIENLLNDGRITSVTKSQKTYYHPSDAVLTECAQCKEDSDKRFETVVNELFTSANGNFETYKTAFFEALCRIFSRLTSAYVVIAKTEQANADKQLLLLIEQACKNIVKKYTDIDNEAFFKAVYRFFEERIPSFDALKWIMAQNHYNMRLLGIDQATNLLAAEMLKGSTLYLDTNVLIGIMMPKHFRYADISDVLKCCSEINTHLIISGITAKEFLNSIKNNTTLLREVLKYIPEGTQKKVHCFVLEEYIATARQDKGLTLDDFLSKYKDPMQVLSKRIEQCIFENLDDWFVTESDTRATEDLDEIVAAKFMEMRKYKKPTAASLHDALMLRWVEKKQNETGNKCLFLTLDQTLVAADKESPCPRQRTIALDVLIQWIAPYCTSEAQVDHLAGVYSEALRCQLLPHEQMFGLNDFEIFRAMEMETAALPAEDVERCILRIKELYPAIDVRKSEDREKLAYEINKMFVDPATKANKKIIELNQLVSYTKQEANDKDNRLRDSEVERLREKKAREKSDAEILKLKNENDKLKTAGNESRRNFAILSAIVVFLFLVAILAVIVHEYSEGKNLFEKIKSSAWYFAAVPMISGFAYRVCFYGSVRAAFCKNFEKK